MLSNQLVAGESVVSDPGADDQGVVGEKDRGAAGQAPKMNDVVSAPTGLQAIDEIDPTAHVRGRTGRGVENVDRLRLGDRTMEPKWRNSMP
jgi:hypothetical protein